MFLDLLASGSYSIISKRLVEVVGIERAYYLTTLIEIYRKAAVKKKYDLDTGMMKLDRKYVQAETTIIPSKQREFDQALEKIAFIHVDPENVDQVSIDVERIESVIVDTDIRGLKELTKAMKIPTSKTNNNSDCIKQMLKNSVVEADKEVKAAYDMWIEATYGKLNKKAQVMAFQVGINQYSDDPKVKAEIIRICTNRSYVDCTYAFGIYETTKQKLNATKLGEQKIATKVKEDVVF